jgi:hypothetical protein
VADFAVSTNFKKHSPGLGAWLALNGNGFKLVPRRTSVSGLEPTFEKLLAALLVAKEEFEAVDEPAFVRAADLVKVDEPVDLGRDVDEP